jgi:hypothetical protein
MQRIHRLKLPTHVFTLPSVFVVSALTDKLDLAHESYQKMATKRKSAQIGREEKRLSLK